MSKLKIGVPSQVFFAWSGGIDFIVRLANDLALDRDLEIFVLVASQGPDVSLKLPAGYVARSSVWQASLDRLINMLPLKRADVQNIKSRFSSDIKFVYYDNSLDGFLRCIERLGIDAVFPSSEPLGRDFPVPWVGYIWDFQHKYLPQYFTDQEIKRRDSDFMEMSLSAPSIIVGSEDVKNDIRKYFRAGAARTVVLPFSHEPIEKPSRHSFKELAKKYHLPKRYLMVSNQFWVHKDHLTAIRGLAKLHVDSKYRDVQLVCTGKLHEPRQPDYIDNIKKEIVQLGLSKSVRLLGYIPKADQVGIMRGALAVIQPTRFEGGRGGGAAVDAMSLGVPIILSDIAINKELQGQRVTFFKTGSPSDLSQKVKIVLTKKIKPVDPHLLATESQKSKIRLSKTLRRAIDMAMRNYKNSSGK